MEMKSEDWTNKPLIPCWQVMSIKGLTVFIPRFDVMIKSQGDMMKRTKFICPTYEVN